MGLFGSSGGAAAAKAKMRELSKGRDLYRSEMRPMADLGFKGYKEIGALLGIGTGHKVAMGRFMETPGLQFSQDQMRQATQRQYAARGETMSGGVLAALQDRAMNLSQQQFGTYLNQLGAFATPGLQAKQGIADMEISIAQQMGQAAAEKEKAKAADKQAMKKQIAAIAIGGVTGGMGMGVAGLAGASGWSGAAMGAAAGAGSTTAFGGGGGGSANYGGSMNYGTGGGSLNYGSMFQSFLGGGGSNMSNHGYHAGSSGGYTYTGMGGQNNGMLYDLGG